MECPTTVEEYSIGNKEWIKDKEIVDQMVRIKDKYR